MLHLKRHELNALIADMSGHPTHWQVNPDGVELGSNWAQVNLAASMLSRTAWMDTTGKRLIVTDHTFPPATLAAVINKLHPESGRWACIYIIKGNAELLRRLRWYHANGQLYPNPQDRQKALEILINAALEARQKAKVIPIGG